MTNMSNILADTIAIVAKRRALIEALPADGAVLFNRHSCLAIKLPDGDADRGFSTGLEYAHVFSDADRAHGADTAGLDRRYSDGNARPFLLTSIEQAKAFALADLDTVLASISDIEDPDA